MRFVPAAALSALGVLASSAWSGRAQSTAIPAPSDSGKTVLRTTSNLVLVDVVVTAKGNVVRGIERSRFHVFEGGREQPLAAFDEHQPVALAAEALSIPAPLPPHTFTNVSAYPQASAANVMLLDELNTPPVNREFLREQMLEYLTTVRPGTSLAIFALTSELRMVQGFTGDATQAIAALKVMKLEDFGGHLSDPQKNIKGDFETHIHRDNDPITDGRTQATLAAAQQLARYLRLIPGRKNLIWFAGSFPVAFDPGASLSAAQVAVYPVDARGMMTMPGARVSDPYDVNDWTNEGDNEAFRERHKSERAAMEQFAEQTGGRAYFDTNGLKQAMANAVENGSSYYTIGYVPAARKLDGKFRGIKVRVDNANYELAYRRGYFAAPSDQSSSPDSQAPSQLTESVVHGAPAATQIAFRARVLPAGDPLLSGTSVPVGPAGEMAAELRNPAQLTIVDVTLDCRSLSFKETPEGARHARVEFTLAAYDTSGKRVNYVMRAIELNIQRALYAKVMTEGVPVRLALDLPVGQSSLRIAVFDLDAGTAGSIEAPVTVGGDQDRSAGGGRGAGTP
jgi:VWFA-related protein